MTHAPQTDAEIILEHFDGKPLGGLRRTVFDLSTSNGATPEWFAADDTPYCRLLFSDRSRISLNVRTEEAHLARPCWCPVAGDHLPHCGVKNDEEEA